METTTPETKNRCAWCTSDPLYLQYHDEEWGRPVQEDRQLFELLILEGAQAGLSWLTILKRRENYRAAFDHFDAQKIARYDQPKISTLLNNPGLIRNCLKIEATITNARAFLAVQKEQGTFARYLWAFVDGKPIVRGRGKGEDLPASTPASEALSRDLKKRGFRFVGPTICYAYMQAVGLVNDHQAPCFLAPE